MENGEFSRALTHAIESKIRMKQSEIRIFIQSQDMRLTLDTPTQPPWAASFGYRKPVSPEPVFVYRGLWKSPIRFSIDAF